MVGKGTVRKKVIAIVAIITAINTIFTGCGDKSMSNGESGIFSKKEDYKEIALKELKERYGEEFEVLKEGGTFAATKDTKKLICNPVGRPDKYTFVQVDDSNWVQDNYINRIMEDKLYEELKDIIKTNFGDEVIVKLYIDSLYPSYDSLDMSIYDFINENPGINYVGDIFIKSDGNIDKKVEAAKITNVLDVLMDKGIKINAAIEFWYIPEVEYNKVNDKYTKLELDNKVGEYYRDENIYFNSGYGRIKDGEIKFSADEIERYFTR